MFQVRYRWQDVPEQNDWYWITSTELDCLAVKEREEAHAFTHKNALDYVAGTKAMLAGSALNLIELQIVPTWASCESSIMIGQDIRCT